MSEFSADWLARREPYDRRARNRQVLDAVAAAMNGRGAISIVDLACGTGSTMRSIAPLISARQNWRLVDNDLSLLGRAAARPPSGATVTGTPIDLARDVEAALIGPLDLVTTSAFLDLVSAEWLERFVVELAVRHLSIYAALNFNGSIELDPVDSRDAPIIAALNADQSTDKGFGPALGPAAGMAAIQRLQALGYQVVHGESDWILGPDDQDIQTDIVNLCAAVARQSSDLTVTEISGWLAKRQGMIAARSSSIRIGHTDFFGLPTGTRSFDRLQSNNTSSPKG